MEESFPDTEKSFLNPSPKQKLDFLVVNEWDILAPAWRAQDKSSQEILNMKCSNVIFKMVFWWVSGKESNNTRIAFPLKYTVV